MKKLDLLSKIQKVEAPPFLLTRIQAKIKAEEAIERLPRSWKWAGSLALGVLVVLNVYSINVGVTTQTDTAKSLIVSLGLQQNNNLYDE